MKSYLTTCLMFLQLFCYQSFLIGQQLGIPTMEDLKISINPQSTDKFLTVVGHVENVSESKFENLKYRLTVTQKKKKYSRNRQSNKFFLEGNEKKNIGKVKIKYSPQSIYDIRLEIFHDTTLVTFLEISNELEKEILGTGLLIDGTRTKKGRDFYRLFNKNWLNAEVKTDAMVKIIEKPGRSRSTQISIYINEKLIFRQNTVSRYDQIKKQAKWAFDELLYFLEQNPSVNNSTDTEDLLGNGLN